MACPNNQGTLGVQTCLQSSKIVFSRGSAPDPAVAAQDALPYPCRLRRGYPPPHSPHPRRLRHPGVPSLVPSLFRPKLRSGQKSQERNFIETDCSHALVNKTLHHSQCIMLVTLAGVGGCVLVIGCSPVSLYLLARHWLG